MSTSPVIFNAIKGGDLRVGTIPSVNASPNKLIGVSYSLDGGLISSNIYQSNPTPTAVSDQFYWIGPDGTFLEPVLSQFSKDVFSTWVCGGWFDPINNLWVAIPDMNYNPNAPYFGNLIINNNKFYYSNFNLLMPLEGLINANLYVKDSQTHKREGYGGYSNILIYGGIDQFILTQQVTGNSYLTELEISIPYGIENMDLIPAYYSTAYSPSQYPYPAPAWEQFTSGPNYRIKGRGLFCCGAQSGGIIPSTQVGFSFLKDGIWFMVMTKNGAAYKGRLWNGFAFTGVFSDYDGVCYTEDFITFSPLKDVTGNIDFSISSNFASVSNGINTFFHSGFGFSYVANYSGGVPWGQAAYKIYPAFNFSPLIPDKFFVPNVCGCNNSAPILKNGVIQHG